MPAVPGPCTLGSSVGSRQHFGWPAPPSRRRGSRDESRMHRTLLITAALVWVLASLLPAALSSGILPSPFLGARAQAANPIVVENQNPGSDQWQLYGPGKQVSSDSAGQIKGYASSPSINRGE